MKNRRQTYAPSHYFVPHLVCAVWIALLLVLPNVLAGEKDWPMWRCDAARSGSSAHELPVTLSSEWQRGLPPLTACWDDPVNIDRMPFNKVYEPIVLGRTMVICSSHDDSVFALDTRSGVMKWKVYLDGPVRLPPAGSKDTVYVTSDDGCLHALDLATGKQQWRVRGGPDDRLLLGNQRLISLWPARGGVVVRDNVAYFAAGIWPGMGVFPQAVDATTGKRLWLNDGLSMPYLVHPHGAQSFGGVVPQGALALDGDDLYLPGGRTLPARLDAGSGALARFDFGGKSEGSSDICVGEGVTVCTRSVMTTVYDAKDQRVRGRFKDLSHPVLSDGMLWLAGSTIKQFDLAGPDREDVKGKRRRYRYLNLMPEGLVVDRKCRGDLIKSGSRCYGADAGKLFALDMEGQLLWEAAVSGNVGRLIAADDRLFAVTVEGDIYSFSATGQKAPERFPAPSREHPSASNVPVVSEMLQGLPVKRGLCLVYGIQDDGVLSSLVSQSELTIVSMETERRTMARRRDLFSKAGIPAGRISFKPLKTGVVPSAMAALTVCGQGVAASPEMLRSICSSIRPYGGSAWFLDAAADLRANAAMLNLPGVSLAEKGRSLVLHRPGALPGSAPWTHQHADVANTVKSDDQLVRSPVGVLWFGGSSHMNVLPRHGHGPGPLVVGGRLFIQGIDRLNARDVYTGFELWSKEYESLGTKDVYYNGTHNLDWRAFSHNQVHMVGANARGGNMVATRDHIYLLNGSACLVIDPATGDRTKTIVLPAGDGGETPDWGYLGVSGRYLIATSYPLALPTSAPRKGAAVTDPQSAKGPAPLSAEASVKALMDYAKMPGAKTCSRKLVVFDRHTGQVLWQREANSAWRHNAIAASPDTVFCVDALTTPQNDHIKSKGIQLSGQPSLFALRLADGVPVWQEKDVVFGTWLAYSGKKDLLIQASRPSRDMVRDESGNRAAAHQGASGKVIWDKAFGFHGRPMIHNEAIYFDVAGEHRAVSLMSGEPLLIKHPLTGAPVRSNYYRKYGCNTPVACEHLLTFRSGAAGFFDLEQGGMGNFAGFRSGCTSSLIPADGVLNAPDYTRTCICNYQNQTSLAFIHMPDMEHWVSVFLDVGDMAEIDQVGINLGAPGDRRDAAGTLWLDIPSRGGASPSIPVSIEGLDSYCHHSLRFTSKGGLAWVGASGVKGAGTLEVRPVLKPRTETAPLRYAVTLIFSEPDSAAVGERVFDVKVQGQKVLSDMDLARDAGARVVVSRAVGEFDVADKLRIELIAQKGVPILSGIELKRVESSPGKIDFFDAYHRPDLPREEWPSVPEIVKRTHTWDRIPRYLAISKNEERFGKWTEEELSALAAHDIIQLSTPTEYADRRDLAAELKRRNPDLIILGYRNLVLDYASMDGERFQKHPDWYLKERKTGEYAVHGRDNPWKSRRPVFDLRNPEVREWWIEDVNEQLNLPNFDSVLIDAFAKAITPWGPRRKSVGESPEELLEANRSLHLLLEENLRVNGEQGVLIGNALRSIYPDCLQSHVDAYLHGSYLEAVEQKRSNLYHVHLAHLIDTCIRMQQEGGQKLMCITMTHLDPPKSLASSSGEGAHVYDEVKSKAELSHADMLELMRKNFEYKLAVALTMASNYFYFGYASGHIADGRPLESLAPDYPEFKRPLGPPLGPAVKTAPYRYKRRFKHASVAVDVAARDGRIDWHTNE